jgi:hypothetical protein
MYSVINILIASIFAIFGLFLTSNDHWGFKMGVSRGYPSPQRRQLLPVPPKRPCRRCCRTSFGVLRWNAIMLSSIHLFRASPAASPKGFWGAADIFSAQVRAPKPPSVRRGTIRCSAPRAIPGPQGTLRARRTQRVARRGVVGLMLH